MDLEATKLYKPFKKEWIEEPEYKDWLREVVNEPEKFHCKFCQRTYLGSKTEFKKHAKSQKHIKIEIMHKAGISVKEIQREKSINASDYSKKFRLAWLDEEDFKIWLLPVAGASDKFECSFCDKEYFGGKSEIIKHFKSSKHKIVQQKVYENEKVKQEYIRVVSQRLEEINELTDSENKIKTTSTVFTKNEFDTEFLEKPEFKNWLIIKNEPKKFGCSLCKIEKFGGIKEIKEHLKTQCHINAQLLHDAENDETPQFLLELEDESIDMNENPQEIIDEEFNTDIEVYDTYEDTSIQEDLSQDTPEIVSSPEQINFLKLIYDSAPDTFDVFLICNDKTIVYAHRTVLAASCEFFRDIFNSSVHFEVEQVIHIYLPDYTYEVMQLLLQFLYTGEVCISQNLVEEFTAVCHELKIRSHSSNSKDPAKDPILADLASFLNFNDCQEDCQGEFSQDVLQTPVVSYQIEEIEEDLESSEEDEYIMDIVESNICKAVNDITAGEDIKLVSLRYNIDQKTLLDRLHTQAPLKFKRKPPDHIENPQMAKKPKLQHNPKTVFQLRAEQSNFKKRLQEAVTSIKSGSSLETAEEEYGIPIKVLQRNIKGIV